MQIKEITVQRDNFLADTEMRHLHHASPKHLLGRYPRPVKIKRLIPEDLSFRELRRHPSQQPLACGRGHRIHQQGQSLTRTGRQFRLVRVQKRQKFITRRFLSTLLEITRPVRVIQIKHRSLGETVDRTIAFRMQAVALHMRRPAFKSRHHQRRTTARLWHHRGIIKRLSGNDPLDVLRIRKNARLGAAARSQTKPSHGGGRPHQLHEIAARLPSVRFVGHHGRPLREFTGDPLPEFGRVVQFAKTPEILPALRLLGGMLPNAFAHLVDESMK